MTYTANTPSFKIGDGNANCGNIIGCFNNANVYKSDEDAQIMRWLSPIEPNNRHQAVRTDRFNGVGDWLLETSEFREWRDNGGGVGKPVLFCSGNPGVGKTYVISLVIDNLCDQARGEDIAVACLYCDFLSQQEQTITNLMGAILKQLVGRGEIPGYLREAFEEGKKEIGGRGLTLPDLMGMLRIAVASLPQVFICIDALDECLPKHLPDFLGSLGDIVRECPRTRILLTGRPHVKEDIQRYLGEAVVISISPNTDDIRNYLEMRLDRDTEPEAMNDDLRADIVRTILEKISDIFLLVSLNMDSILGEVTVRQRRKKLEEMTRGNGLSDAYTATLTRLKAQKGSKSILGLRVLMWVAYSGRPLRARELCHALGVEVGSADLDIENVPALRTLLSSSLGLVTVEASSSTLRLVHFTLQEHLSSDPTLFDSPHSTLAQVCLTYLNFGSVRDLPPTLLSAPPTTPFLKYASCYWGDHARKGMTENVKTLALRLLDRFDEHISAQLMLLRYEKNTYSPPYYYGVRGPKGFTGLHAVAFLPIAGLVSSVLKMKEWDINAIDSMGSTALTWAAIRGQEEVVKMLLERGDVNPNMEDTEYGRTPLSWAAGKGYEQVVKVLLGRGDVNPNTADTVHGRTPLSWAAWSGQEGVVKMLLAREDINPNTVDTGYGQTPLSWASENGHEGIVRMLLERDDVNPNAANTEYGRTPLLSAAENGHEGIVKILLEREDVNPNAEYGWTPLSRAAENGHEGVVKMLLERRDVNPNTADTEYGQTPLSWASENGHKGIVKMLLRREDVNPNTADAECGRTPLLWAAGNGRKVIVGMLLARGDVNPNTADTEYGRTPLWRAAEIGHEGIVKMLLKRQDVDPNTADTGYGQTPISLASENGHKGIVKMLLKRQDVNPNTADTEYGRSPLSLAVRHGHEPVVKMLLARVDVNPNTADTGHGRTPLSLAAESGHEAVVKMLLGRRDVNPNQADTKYGRTPLSWAAENGHEGVVKMLRERKDIFTATPDNQIQTLPWLASSTRHLGVLSTHPDRINVNSNNADHGGWAPPPLPSGRVSERCVLEMRFKHGLPDTNIADLNAQPLLPSADPDEQGGAPDLPGYVSESANSNRSSTEPSVLPQPHPTWYLSFGYPPAETGTHTNTRSNVFTAISYYFIIATCVCPLVLFIYIVPSFLPDIFLLHK